MAEEIDESGFYREDFSTESDWEVFNAQLGELFQKWELSEKDWGRELAEYELFSCEWQVRSEIIEWLKKPIAVNYYTAELGTHASDTAQQRSAMCHDLMSLQNTFAPQMDHGDLHPLARLYGLRRFVVIQPHPSHTQFLMSLDEFGFFLSSATMAAAEVSSTVPIFVQIYKHDLNCFLGVGMAKMMRTDFDVLVMKQSPPELHYLTGLLNIFKEKLPAMYLNPIKISVRNIYAFDTINLHIPMRIPFAKANSVAEPTNSQTILSTSQFSALPYGYFTDSHTEMYAVHTWQHLSENMLMDSELRSDFVPSKSQCGTFLLSVHATSYLSSCLHDYQRLGNVTETLEAFVGRNFSGVASATEQSHPLDQLTQTQMPHLGGHRQRRNYVGDKQQSMKKLPGPMNDNELNQMLYYLFPDLHPDVALFPYPATYAKHIDPHRIKSALPDSLVCRLSCLLATCNAHFGNKSGLAQIWAAFTRELRFLWDNCLRIPGVAPGYPDTRTCLLHQKLQMLNVCLQRRELNESGAKGDSVRQSLNESTSEDDGNDDDEFYDCANYEDDLHSSAASGNKPEGRLRRLGELKLLDSDEPLFVPVTQEPVPKTEDQLHDDAEEMLKLGPGSGLTTQMMCSSLRSDMEAFKAANPNAQMADFIRWYSPRDWLEAENVDDAADATKCGKLSARMLTPDNTWQTVWKQAQAVPVWRQKRLFDETKEGLKVLQYFESRTIAEIYALTLIPLLHAALLTLKDIFDNSKALELFNTDIDAVLADLCRLSRDVEIVGQTEYGAITQVPSAEPIIKKIEALEGLFYEYKCFESIHERFFVVHESAQELWRSLKCPNGWKIIETNPEMLRDVNDEYARLISKDYVLRVSGETTATEKGDTGPQFMRAIITGESVRLCGAFTADTAFL